MRILAVESLRFPGEGSSAQGKSGPKDARDAGEEGNRGRGKTRTERDSEN